MDVNLVMAMTLDGKIARNETQMVTWSGAADKRFFVQITREAGVVIMGSRTYDTIGRPLKNRRNIVMTRNQSRISSDPDLIFTDLPPRQILEGLSQEGFTQVALIGGSKVNASFATEGLITRMYLTLVPVIFGRGLSLFDGDLDLSGVLVSTRKLDDGHLLLTYHINARGGTP
jgi:dihydrofolate reductase